MVVALIFCRQWYFESEMLILIYFVTLIFVENHSVTVQRDKVDAFDRTFSVCGEYSALWKWTSSCKCDFSGKNFLMSDDK